MAVRSDDLGTKVRFTNGATDQLTLAYAVVSDTNDRLQMQADGTLVWGSGSAAGETKLYRSSSSVLKIETAGGETLRLEAHPGSGECGLRLIANIGGTMTLSTVSMGAADGGGTGYRVLLIPN